jgi:hypothetical protein
VPTIPSSEEQSERKSANDSTVNKMGFIIMSPPLAAGSLLGVECATKAHVAGRAAPVSDGKDHRADHGNDGDQAEDRFGEPEEGGALFSEC